MEQQEERIIRLEERVHHERERTDYHLAHHAQRLTSLESRPHHGLEISQGSGIKLLLAVGLTLLAFFLTGDPRSALTAARIGLGMP